MKDKAVLFLAGVGVGAAAAVLMAPSSGDELRGRIRDGANRAKDAMQPAAIKGAIGDVVERGRQALNEKLTPVKTDALKGKVHDGIDDAAAAAKKTSDRLIDKSANYARQASETVDKTAKRLQEV